MNQINLLGRLTKEPETFKMENGIKYAKSILAVTRKFDNTKTDFIPLMFWRNQAEYIGKYGQKGMRILITGRLEINQVGESNDYKVFTQVVVDNVEIINDKKQKEQVIEKKAYQVEHVKNEDEEKDVPWEIKM